MCVLIRILLYGYNVDINQRIGTSIGDECEVSVLKTMFCSYSNKTTCNFHMDNFPEGGGGGVTTVLKIMGLHFHKEWGHTYLGL